MTRTTEFGVDLLRQLPPQEGYRHVAFDIPLVPVPCPRPRTTSRGITYYPKNYNVWRKGALEYIPSFYPLLQGTVGVFVSSVCPPFKTVTREFPRGDVDNFTKAVLDAITKSEMVWQDDAQVVVSHAIKRFTRDGEDPHTHVYIREVTKQ